ncbi:MAG TPA: glutamine synthetase [Geminicoccaceae bacterium]|nr:glutamine synthetase [Geminicoccaceae bacterium]
MDTASVRTADDARAVVEERGLSHVKLGLFDLDGVLRGKYVSRAKFLSALEGGFGFCDVVLGWDSDDQLYDNVRFTGWHTGYPDAPALIVPETCRDLPLEDGLLFLAEFAGPAEALCPRGLLRRVVARAEAMGFAPYAALEYEFFLFAETPDSARAKGWRDLKPLTPGNFGYSVLRSSVWADFHKELLALSDAMRFPLEGLHTETGPGVLEAAITVDGALEAADRAALFKTFTKVLAQRHDMMATFMARWSNAYAGQSGHVHLSLRDRDGGGAAFHDPDAPDGLSPTLRSFVAGQQRLMPELLCMTAATVNSFSRLVPGFWAPTAATWGIENRTTSIRVIPGSPKSQRVEYRVAAADANPYLTLAAAIASGLHGIERGLKPTEPVRGNAYQTAAPEELQFPRTLTDAAARLRGSAVAREWFGDAFVEHFAATREWEDRQYRAAITDWELRRYFEII